MSDSNANGHFEPQNTHPLVRPPEGTRAARGVPFDLDEEPTTEASFTTESAEQTMVSPGQDELEEERRLEQLRDEERELESMNAVREVEVPESFLAAHGLTKNGDGGGGEPPDDTNYSFNSQPSPGPTPRDKEQGLIEHLAELRTRILWCFGAVMVAMALTWHYTPQLSAWFTKPIFKALLDSGTKVPGPDGKIPNSEIIITDPTAAFTIYLQVSLVSALILTMPFLLFQVWRFVEPALTNSERRYTLILVPFASILFFMGVALGYEVSPLFYQFFLQFQPPGVAAKWDYMQSVVLMAKMLLVFGIAFQVPVVTIFLNKSGLVSRNLLIDYWRHAVVVIFVIVAILTPTWDPITLTVCATPPCLLYILSIWMVKWL